MDWNTPYTLTRSLRLEIAPDGKLMATACLSRPEREVPSEVLPILQCFAGKAVTPRAALADLTNGDGVRKETLASAVDELLAERFLVPDDRTELAAPDERGFGASPSLPGHHSLLTDAVRVLSYRAAILRSCRDKVVLEIGCGSGILSIFAAQAGARRVIAVEEMEVAELAAEMFRANGCDDVVELYRTNSLDFETDEPADVLIHEIFGVDPFAENVLPVLADARERLLKPDAQLLPSHIEVFALGLEVADELHRDQARALAEAREFGGLYGVDFGPYLSQLEASRPALFPRPYGRGYDDEPLFRPRVLTEELRLLDLDLKHPGDPAAALTGKTLQISERGTLGAITLYFRAHLDDATVITTSPFAPLTAWGRKVRTLSRRLAVEAGDEVPLDLELVFRHGWQRLLVDLAERAGIEADVR